MFIFSDFPYCFGESTKKYKLWNFSGFSEKKIQRSQESPKVDFGLASNEDDIVAKS